MMYQTQPLIYRHNMLTKEQKEYLDKAFNANAFSSTSEAEFVKSYAGKMSLQIDVKKAYKYVTDKVKKSETKTAVKKAVKKMSE